jgi:hypothetical protein
MGMAEDYIEALKSIEDIVEGIHDKMSEYCQFIDKLSDDPNTKDCLFYGRPAKHCCAREICPILEEE